MQVPAATSRDVQRRVAAEAAAAIAVKRRARNTMKCNGNATEMQRRERVCCAVLVVVQIFHVARCNVQLKVGAVVVIVVVERQLQARSRVTA